MSRWVIVGEKKVRLLHAAELGSETDDSFRPGKEFEVIEEVLVGDRKFLRLPDGRFVCERSRKEINKVVAKRLDGGTRSRSFAVGQKVEIKQKTKSRHGTLVKLNPSKAVVEISEGGQNRSYHVPYGMLCKEEQGAKASQAKAKPKAAVRQPKAKVKPAVKKDLPMASHGEESTDNDEDEESSSDNDEKAHRRGWEQVFSAFQGYGVHPSMVSEMFDHKDLIFMGRKDYWALWGKCTSPVMADGSSVAEVKRNLNIDVPNLADGCESNLSY